MFSDCRKELSKGTRCQSPPTLLECVAKGWDTERKGNYPIVFIADDDKIFFVDHEHKLIDQLLFHALGKGHRAVKMAITKINTFKHAVLIAIDILLFAHLVGIDHVELAQFQRTFCHTRKHFVFDLR